MCRGLVCAAVGRLCLGRRGDAEVEDEELEELWRGRFGDLAGDISGREKPGVVGVVDLSSVASMSEV